MEDIEFDNIAFASDPYPLYRQLREAEEPYWLSHTQSKSSSPGFWLFSRYADVVDILKLSGPLSKQITRVRSPDDITPMDLSMLNQDPPEHTRLRNLVNQTFTARQIKELEPRIEKIIDELIARMRMKVSGDFVADFALHIPVMVIAELLGVPPEDKDKFRHWSRQIIIGYDSVIASTGNLEQQETAMQALIYYFNQLIEKRRQHPYDDLISSLINAYDRQGKLSPGELLGMCVLFLIAGFETTVNLLSNGLYTILRYPEQFQLLRQCPEYLPSAIEEMLRFESPIQRSTFRITTEACKLGGKQLNQGEQICAMIGAANRDPEQFPQPDTFDITRTPNRHLAFGLGIHTCLGAVLARTEARIVFERVLDQLPNIRLSSKTPEWNTTTFFRGLRVLPVHY